MSLFTTLLTSKIAAGTIAACTLAAGGTAAAAATGSLPQPLQQSAHDAVGAPAPAPALSTVGEQGEALTGTATGTDSSTIGSGSVPSTPASQPAAPTATKAKGPDATGPAKKGLCTAWTNGGLHNPKSTAFKALATAAGAAADADLAAAQTAVTGYCTAYLASVKAGSDSPTSIPVPIASTGTSNSGDDAADEPEPVKSKAAKHANRGHHHSTATARSTRGEDEQESDDSRTSSKSGSSSSSHRHHSDDDHESGDDD